MTEGELAAIVDRLRKLGTDDELVEVKESALVLSKDLWESVSAFANTNGGLILLGVSERNNFVPVDDFRIDWVRERFEAGMEAEGPESKLVNPPRYTLQELVLEGSPVLAIDIAPLGKESNPCYVLELGPTKGAFKRVGDGDICLFSAQSSFLL